MFGGKPSSALADQSARIVVPDGWGFGILSAWAFIASLALLRVAFGLWRIRCLRRECTPIKLADLDPSVVATIEQLRPKRSLALLESETRRVPMAVGFFRSAVILPKWALAELSATEFFDIFIHELAQLLRLD